MPESFHYDRNDLYCEEVPLAEIAAKAGTPCYVYSSRGILETYKAYDEALDGLPHRVCYAVKANSTLGVLALLASAGSGFDIVSAGELYRVIQAGGDPGGVVFSGVGKTADEVEYALEAGIHAFNCESDAELALIDALAARRGARPRVSVRVNPDIDAGTHPYISTGLREQKFGIAMEEAEEIYARGAQMPNLLMDGVSCHIGSQLLDTSPMIEAVDCMLALVDRLRARDIPIASLDLGGGLGVPYRPGEQAPSIRSFAAELRRKVEGRGLFLLIEPGRSIVGEAGALLTRVLYRKCAASKQFIVVDAAMNDLIRPSLYQSHHEIVPVRNTARPRVLADVVGPICESGDFLARDREIADVLPGDLLAVATAGAYGFVAASNYNSRVRPPEVLVEGASWRVIRARETFEDLIRGETR
ncbi:MAG: diaminopimelate decarboxylase [Acidobacteriota bacterium]